MPKNHQYKIIDMGNTSESIESCTNKLLNQIPKGKAILFHNQDQTLKGKILVQIMRPEDIPPIRRPHNQTKAILKRAGFKHITETDKTNSHRKQQLKKPK